MKSLESFKAQSPPQRRVSKIQKFRDDIIDLYNSERSVEQIQKYLLQNGVKISTRRIYQFLKQNLNNQNSSLRTPAASLGGSEKSKPQQQSAQNSKAVSAYMQKLQKIAKET
jgi:IS30 family transposase